MSPLLHLFYRWIAWFWLHSYSDVVSFRLQIYFNGHNFLAVKLKEHGIGYTMIDNAFDSIADPVKAQELSDSVKVEEIHRKLEELAWKYCPVYKELGLRYHWSVMQAEYSIDHNCPNFWIKKSSWKNAYFCKRERAIINQELLWV